MTDKRDYYLIITTGGRLRSFTGPWRYAVAVFLRLPWEDLVTSQEFKQLQSGGDQV